MIDVGIGHAHDGRMVEVDRPGVAGGLLAHLRRRLARVQPPHQDAVLDQVVLARRHAFVIVAVRAQSAGQRAVIQDVQAIHAEALAQLHQLLHALVFVDEVRLAQVTEGLVGEYARSAAGR